MMLRQLSIAPGLALSLVISMLFGGALSLVHAQSLAISSGDAYAATERARAQSGKNVDASVFDSIALQLEIADRISKDYPTQASAFRARAARWTKVAEQGGDPLLAAQGQIVMRGYSSAVSRVRQGYSVYLPPPRCSGRFNYTRNPLHRCAEKFRTPVAQW